MQIVVEFSVLVKRCVVLEVGNVAYASNQADHDACKAEFLVGSESGRAKQSSLPFTAIQGQEGIASCSQESVNVLLDLVAYYFSSTSLSYSSIFVGEAASWTEGGKSDD